MSAGLATVAYDGESFVYLLIFSVVFQKFMVYYKSSHFLKIVLFYLFAVDPFSETRTRKNTRRI